MYTIAVKRTFIAQHYLIGGDWGAENEPHSHHYALELQLTGDSLDQHGYLVDIVDIEAHLDAIVTVYQDRLLNDMPPFNPDGRPLNPSIEHFSRILCHALIAGIHAPHLTAITVKLWENDIAWAGYTLPLPAPH
ncbi:MAG: 6-carboxytetrahydropterin synthase [Anaerolineales bacterium]|nr:6-carboxytetrahydropterin synthase [Anaerolineales bacterium]MCB8954337.1 6-carboxytetrahydropterin synthase [Ardenticatenales bacterium]